MNEIAMRILHQNALSGSIVNSDVIHRVIQSDLEAIFEILNSVRMDSLRSHDRDLFARVIGSYDRLATIIALELPAKVSDLTSRTSDYVVTQNDEHLELLISSINKFKDDLSAIEESIGVLETSVLETLEDLKSSSAANRLSNLNEHILTLYTHVSQMFIILLTMEGSAVQCRMTL